VERLRLELPAGMTVHMPVPVHLERDYAEYRSSYSVEGHALIAEWHLWIRKNELPPGRAEDLAAFNRAVLADQAQKLLVNSNAPATPIFSPSTSARELYNAGLQAFNNGKFKAAAELFEGVVSKDVNFKGAWNDLGRTYLSLGRLDKAVDALRKAIEINPYDEYAFNNLGRALQMQGKYDEATEAYKKQIEINPLDHYSHSNLGQLYLDTKKYDLAARELDTAGSITASDPSIFLSLGRAYLNLGQSDKATQAFDRAVELAPTPSTWNDVAYELAKCKMDLGRAEQYSASAVSSTVAQLRSISLGDLTLKDVGLVRSIATYWDTFGWVKFQQGDIMQAEKYVRSSWRVNYSGEVANHLAQIYEKQNRKREAIHAYEWALASFPRVLMPETRQRLATLVGNESKIDDLVNAAGEELSSLRTLKLKNPGKVDGNAEFWVLLAPGPKTEAVRFISGDDKLRAFSSEIRSLTFVDMFPDATDTKLIRRGILSCSHYTNECAFILVSANDIRSVD
jgi:tetratricopeptide (TPR) repeat protein